ncbi:hypothetical protein KNU96_gp08 [Xanthomonas phage FoX5]|uniref:Uncharacterized protein n=1 Tax=Xanthomonas phage FoX5 TaxID=2723901 RepID=A0A858NQN8_9CAUD|nr:hypothetical protein KNU96_gp08 [Xanthomonas phage FoX5]QJB21986.1 hypothetical protein XccvBFoX5_gp08c [Xanthomonas phage FoX5]
MRRSAPQLQPLPQYSAEGPGRTRRYLPHG